MKELICICCPKGCHLKIDVEHGFTVTGNGCERGADYGRKELTFPTRTITSTVRIKGGIYNRCPVKTAAPIPKDMIFEAMCLLDGVELTSPVKVGDIVVADICGTRIPFIATRNM